MKTKQKPKANKQKQKPNQIKTNKKNPTHIRTTHTQQSTERPAIIISNPGSVCHAGNMKNTGTYRHVSLGNLIAFRPSAL